jgi:hypothetical protein
MRGAADTEFLLSGALEHLRSALELLDRASAPGQIGARVDQAISELYVTIAERGGDGRLVAGDGLKFVQ